MKTKIIEDKSSIETAFNEATTDIGMLAEEMRTWADNMSGTPLESTMKYEQVDECAEQLEEAQSNLEDIQLSDEVKTTEIQFKYTMPISKYIGRSWRLGQAISALEAVANKLDAESGQEIQNIVDELQGIEFPGMY